MVAIEFVVVVAGLVLLTLVLVLHMCLLLDRTGYSSSKPDPLLKPRKPNPILQEQSRSLHPKKKINKVKFRKVPEVFPETVQPGYGGYEVKLDRPCQGYVKGYVSLPYTLFNMLATSGFNHRLLNQK